jgi:hypothetical protein
VITGADTCRKYVLPKLYAAGWSDDQISEQKTFTDGRIETAAELDGCHASLHHRQSVPWRIVTALTCLNLLVRRGDERGRGRESRRG